MLLVTVMLLAKLATGPFGDAGLFALSGTSGLLDVDPITLSMAKGAGVGVAVPTAALVILTAAAANGVAKSALALVFGGMRLGLLLSAIAMISLAAGTAMVFLH